MRRNRGRTALVAGITIFGMLSCALAVTALGGFPSSDAAWYTPLLQLAAALPQLLIGLIPTMLIIAAGFSSSTKRRVAEYRRLRSVGARDRQILRLVAFEALVPAAFTVALTAIGLLAVLLLLDIPVFAGMVGFPIAAVTTMIAIAGAAQLPARSVLATTNEPVLNRRTVADSPRGWSKLRRIRLPFLALAIGALLLGLSIVGFSGGESALSYFSLVIAVPLVFWGTVTFIDPLLERLGRLTHRLPQTGRLALRDAERNRTRSVALISAAVGITTLAVMASAGLLSDQYEYDRPMDERFVVGPANGNAGETFLETAMSTIAVDRQASVLALGQNGWGFTSVLRRSNGEEHRPIGPPALYSDELALALGMSLDARSAAENGRAVVLSAGRIDALTYLRVQLDVEYVHHPVGVVGGAIDQAVSYRGGDNALPAILLPPSLADELSLSRSPTDDRVLLVAATVPTRAEQVAIATHAGVVPGEDEGFAFSRNRVDFGRGGIGPHDIVRIAAVIAGVLGVVLGLFSAGLAGSDSKAEMAAMVASGARPSIRRRILAAQAWIYLTVGGLVGSALGVFLFWAVTRSDPSVPDAIFPWLAMLMMVVVVPALTALLVALGFRSAKPAISRRASSANPAEPIKT